MRRLSTFLVVPFAALMATTALAAPPADAVVERAGAERLVVRWKSADRVDVLVAARADAQPATASLVSPADRDGAHAHAVAGPARSYFLLRNARTGETVRVAERVVPLATGSNFRDLGGYAAADGRQVRWGLIYRSGGTPLLDAADIERINALGLAGMVDLRSAEERVLAPTRIEGIPYAAIGYSFRNLDLGGGMETTYRGLPEMLRPHLKQVFARLLRDEGPLVYNCSAGQDRTGFATAMVLAALGVERRTIEADYLLSTRYRQPAFEMPRIDPAAHPGDPVAAMFAAWQTPGAAKAMPLHTADGTPFLAWALAEIDRKWGSTDAYLRDAIGLTDADLAKLRATYTE